MEYGGLSAGQIAMNYDWDVTDVPTMMPLFMGPPPEPRTPFIDSIGRIDLTGSLNVGANSHIRYDLNPQLDTTPAVRGEGADYITHVSADGGVVSFNANSQIRLSPNDVNRVVSDGRYVIVSSDSAISGIPGSVSVQFNANVQDFGDHRGTLIPTLTGVQTANISGTNLERFASLSLVNNLTGVDFLGQDLVLTIQHNYAAIGQTTNQSAVGAAIDALTNSSDAAVQDFISALDYSDFNTAVATLETISPENQLAQTVGALSANYRSHRMLENYLASARSSSSSAIRQEVGTSGRFFPSNTSQNIRVWGTVSNDWQDYQDGTNDTEYDGYTTAFTAGVDVRVNSALVLGVMAEGSNAEFDYTAGSQDMDSMRFAAYGTWGQATGFYTNFALGYGNHDMSDSRDLGGIWGVNDSNTDANSFTGLLTVGYTIASGVVKHGPFLGFEYQNMDVDGFNVNGGIVPVSVDDYSVDSLRGLLGYRAESTYGKFVPYASVAYAHEFEDEDIIANASIAGSEFAVTTDTIGSSILMTVGSGYQANEDLFLNLGYRGEIATESNGIDSHGVMFGANYSF
jgi:outer membrane autotransporter protein